MPALVAALLLGACDADKPATAPQGGAASPAKTGEAGADNPAAGTELDIKIGDVESVGHELTFRKRGLAISSSADAIRKRLTNSTTIAATGVAHHHQRPRSSAE